MLLDGCSTVGWARVRGHCSIIAPVVIGLGTVVAAKSRINPGIYGDDKLIGGDNVAKYLLASDDNSRPDSLKKNQTVATQWNEEIKSQIKAALTDKTGYAEATAGLNSELDKVTKQASGGDRQFYNVLAKLSYSSPEVKAAREYFSGLVETIVRQVKI